MAHLNVNRNKIPIYDTTRIERTGDDGSAGRKCRSGENGLQSSTKAMLVLQFAERPEREEDE
jgi:hypothetical protein